MGMPDSALSRHGQLCALFMTCVKRESRMLLWSEICMSETNKIVLTLSFHAHSSFHPPSLSLSGSTRCCETPSCHAWDVFLLENADGFDKMLGLWACNRLPSVPLCAGYQQGPGNTGLKVLTLLLKLLWDRLPWLSYPLEHRNKYMEHTATCWLKTVNRTLMQKC